MKENILHGKHVTLPKTDDNPNINHAEEIIIQNLPDGAEVTRKGISWGGLQRNEPCAHCQPGVDGIGGVYD